MILREGTLLDCSDPLTFPLVASLGVTSVVMSEIFQYLLDGFSLIWHRLNVSIFYLAPPLVKNFKAKPRFLMFTSTLLAIVVACQRAKLG